MDIAHDRARWPAMKNLLWAGVVGPLLFIAVFLIEGFTRPGYSQWKNYVSSLEAGEGGWVQDLNFIVIGVMFVAFAVGLRLALRGSRGAIGVPVLFALAGITTVAAGLNTSDAVLGYPPGAPEVVTSQGEAHNSASLLGFVLLLAAIFVMAWHFASNGSRAWTIYSIAVGVAMIALFVVGGVVANQDKAGTWPNSPTGFLQRLTIFVELGWVVMVALHLVRRKRTRSGGGR